MSERTCSIDGCGKPWFSRDWCSAHYTRWKRHGHPLRLTRTPPIAPGATEKLCPRCGETKPLEAFDFRPSGARKGYCRPCQAAYLVEYVKTPEGRARTQAAKAKWEKEQRLEFDLLKRYGLSLAEYNAMIERQGDRCAICGTDRPNTTKPDQRWHVDHCHTTGRVRGLLCAVCNLAIGKFNDDPHLLRIAVAYLEA